MSPLSNHPVRPDVIAKAICKSGKFETGEGTCALLCMSVLGSARRSCPHTMTVHGDLAKQILAAMEKQS